MKHYIRNLQGLRWIINFFGVATVCQCQRDLELVLTKKVNVMHVNGKKQKRKSIGKQEKLNLHPYYKNKKNNKKPLIV